MPRIVLWTACVIFLVASRLIGADVDVARPEQFVFFGADREQIKNPLFLNTPGFAGAQLSYSWKELEPERDRYDIAIISRDLAFLRANGKKLFIQIQDVTFGTMPADVPDYLRMDPQYKGGANQQYTGGNDADENVTPDGWVARRWDPAVAERFAKLLLALGKEFDGRVAGINLAATSAGFGDTGKLYPAGFTPASYRDAIKKRMKTARDAFPASAVLIYANFMPGEWLPDDDKGYLRSIYEYAGEIGVGVGGPDLQPFKKGQLHHSYPLIRNRKKGILAGVAVQEGNYAEQNPSTQQPISVPELYAFAKDALHLDYIFWCTEEPFFRGMSCHS